MKYLDIINKSKLKIDSEFKTLSLNLKNKELFSELHSAISSYSFVNEFQLVDVTLSFYIPELINSDENGIDISIGLFQIRETQNGITSYTSDIKYDKDDDLIFDKFLYISSSICTTTGPFILENIDYVISTHDVYSFDRELLEAIDSIFVIFNSNIDLMRSKLMDLKNWT